MKIHNNITIVDAVAKIESASGDVSLLVVGLEQCESCKTLRNDLTLLTRKLGILQVMFSYLRLDSSEEIDIVKRLRLTDVPAIYLFLGSKILGGWFGYDLDKSEEFRVGALRGSIVAKLPMKLAAEI